MLYFEKIDTRIWFCLQKRPLNFPCAASEQSPHPTRQPPAPVTPQVHPDTGIWLKFIQLSSFLVEQNMSALLTRKMAQRLVCYG